MRFSLESGILVAEQFLQDLFKKYGKNPVSTDDDGSTWYPQTSRFWKLRHHTHSLILLRKKYHYRTNYSIHQRQN